MSDFHPAFIFLFVRRHLRSEALPERERETAASLVTTTGTEERAKTTGSKRLD